uniref:Cyclin-dependent kinase 12 n=1 Tax=Plectus sambesii TaxID=2011161 RepID=A0A914VG85_9BILA
MTKKSKSTRRHSRDDAEKSPERKEREKDKSKEKEKEKDRQRKRHRSHSNDDSERKRKKEKKAKVERRNRSKEKSIPQTNGKTKDSNDNKSASGEEAQDDPSNLDEQRAVDSSASKSVRSIVNAVPSSSKQLVSYDSVSPEEDEIGRKSEAKEGAVEKASKHGGDQANSSTGADAGAAASDIRQSSSDQTPTIDEPPMVASSPKSRGRGGKASRSDEKERREDRKSKSRRSRSPPRRDKRQRTPTPTSPPTSKSSRKHRSPSPRAVRRRSRRSPSPSSSRSRRQADRSPDKRSRRLSAGRWRHSPSRKSSPSRRRSRSKSPRRRDKERRSRRRSRSRTRSRSPSTSSSHGSERMSISTGSPPTPVAKFGADMSINECILGELFMKKPLFQGNSEMVQLEYIARVCGTPSPEIWPDVVNLPHYSQYRPRKHCRRVLKENFQFLPPNALDLLDKLLELDPKRRCSAKDALLHPWLRNVNPREVDPPQLPYWQDCHEMWSKKQRRIKQQPGTASTGGGRPESQPPSNRGSPKASLTQIIDSALQALPNMTGDEQVAALYDILSQLDKNEMDTVHQHLEMSLSNALKGEHQRRTAAELQSTSRPSGCEDKISDLLTQLASMRKMQPSDPSARKVDGDPSVVPQDLLSAWKTKTEPANAANPLEQADSAAVAESSRRPPPPADHYEQLNPEAPAPSLQQPPPGFRPTGQPLFAQRAPPRTTPILGGSFHMNFRPTRPLGRRFPTAPSVVRPLPPRHV